MKRALSLIALFAGVLAFSATAAANSGWVIDNVGLNALAAPSSLALAFAALMGALLLPRTLRRRYEQRRAKALASTLGR